VPGNELQAAAPKAAALPLSSPVRLDAGNVDGDYFVNCSNSDGSTSSGMAYYAQLNPGQNVGHQPNDYVDINNSAYIDWVHPGAGMPHILIHRIRRTDQCSALSQHEHHRALVCVQRIRDPCDQLKRGYSEQRI
jgi:hypothetical protein